MADVTPPVLQGPSSKEKKYDRQLRLWAASGQAALEDAHILLINSGSGVVGIETLKNLVLPGIGQYTILDSEEVREADLGVNFFLDVESLGQPRAKRCCELLQELNPDVKGHYITHSLETLVEKAHFLQPYTHIFCVGPAKFETLRLVIHHAGDNSVPFFYMQSIGFYSQFSVSLPAAFPVVDTHPDPLSTMDLRLLCPWPALKQFAKEKTSGLDSMNDHDHGHVPFVLLLLHYIEDWKLHHNQQIPQTYKEKTEFRNLISKGARTDNPEGGEENYDEAVAAVLKSINPPSLASSTKEVFQAKECTDLSSRSANFWIIAAAIRQFYERHHLLPLPGSVPDMKAQSADYIQLQNLYKTKARRDLAEVLDLVESMRKTLGKSAPLPDQEVEAFCKGAASIKVIRGSLLKVNNVESETVWGDRARYIWQELQDPESLISIHLAFLVWNLDYNDGKAGHHPSSRVDRMLSSLQEAASRAAMADAENSQKELQQSRQKVMTSLGELERAQGAELHNISALTGGLIAQEAIKIITKQYIPINNTCIFDGITSKTATMRLF